MTEINDKSYVGQLVNLCVLLDMFIVETDSEHARTVYGEVWDEACKLIQPVDFHKMITKKMEQS